MHGGSDALALTAITCLTWLALNNLGWVGDGAAIAPACALKHLEHLSLRNASIDLSSSAF
jgi:hypothetical protein